MYGKLKKEISTFCAIGRGLIFKAFRASGRNWIIILACIKCSLAVVQFLNLLVGLIKARRC
jgi:hypothetical protein